MKKLKTIIYPNLILEKINLSRKNHIPQSKIFKQSQENLNKLQVIINKNKITDLPKDWREGSVLLTENKKVFFEILRKYK